MLAVVAEAGREPSDPGPGGQRPDGGGEEPGVDAGQGQVSTK